MNRNNKGEITAMKKKKKRLKHDENKISKIYTIIISAAFVVVMTMQIGKVWQKKVEKIALQEELQQELLEEQTRQEELKRYQMYIESEEYIEDMAESKLGLLYDNQIIFREIKE